MDLDAAAAAHKHHDGDAVHRRIAQQLRDRVGAKVLAVLGHQTEGLLALGTEPAQHLEELMRVLHIGPGLGQRGYVDLGIGLDGRLGRRLAEHIACGGLGKALHQCIPGCHVRDLARKHLVHGTAGCVIELQAAHGGAIAVGGLLGHGKAGMPVHEEQTQIDLAAQRQTDRSLGREVLIDAVFFMHGGFIARERHHGAAGFQGFKNVQPFGAQRQSLERAFMLAAMGGDDRAFAQLQRLGRILGAQALLALLRELLTDLHRSHGLDFRGCDGVHCRVSGL